VSGGEISMVLEHLWAGMLTHLWQSCLILTPLLLLGRILHRAPARAQYLFWNLALLKLVLPLELCGRLTSSLWPAAPEAGSLTTLALLLTPAMGLPEGMTPSAALSGILIVTLSLLWLTGLLREAALAFRHAGGSSHRRPEPGERALLLDALPGEESTLASIRLCGDRRPPRVEGLLWPIIVLPRFILDLLDSDELRSVILHEEFHRRRRDPLRLFGGRLLGAALLFFPLVAVLRRRLQRSIELLCDERVLSTGIPPETYAGALGRTLAACLQPQGDPLAVHLGERGRLRHRIDRILQQGRTRLMPIHKTVLIAAAVLVLLGSFLPLSPMAGGEELAFDTPPRIVKMVPPEYPERAKKAKASGTVLVQLHLDAQGALLDSELLEGVPGWPEMAEAALAVLPGWTFEPARLDGEAVAAKITLPIRFALSEKEKKGIAEEDQ
jgi:TonB family protein